MKSITICHAREVRRFVTIEAETVEEALAKAQALDADESDSEEWEIEDNDPGEYAAREVKEL